MVFSSSALAASWRCGPPTSTKTGAIRTHQDWCLLAHAGSNFVHALLHERGAAFDWYVNIGNREGLAFHHHQREG
jgi:hypothetical protein